MENNKNDFSNEVTTEDIENFFNELSKMMGLDYKSRAKNNKSDSEVTNKDIKESEKIQKGDRVKIISGEFKSLEIIGEVVDFCKLFETAVVKFGEFNALHINVKDLEVVESKKDKDEAKAKRLEMLAQAKEEQKQKMNEYCEFEEKLKGLETELKNLELKINNLSK